MDRRQRKTREAIFEALIGLLSEKEFARMTVGEIIDRADVGRATFYAHFETKDHLLKELCEDLFCHIFDEFCEEPSDHRHLFHCDPPESVFLHLLQHLQKNDNHIRDLLCCRNNELFLRSFKTNLQALVVRSLPLFEAGKNQRLPETFWVNHVASTFTETVRWWIENGMEETPETINGYFHMAVLGRG